METPQQKQALAELKADVSFGKNTVFSINKADTEPDTKGGSLNSNSKPYAIWGPKNDYPQAVLDENEGQETSAGALLFKIQAHYGRGLFFHKKEIDPKTFTEKIIPIPISELPAEIQDFYYNNDLENFFQGTISDFECWWFFHTQYLINKAGNKIIGVNWIRTKDARSEKRNNQTGRIENFYVSGKWPTPQNSAEPNLETEVAKIPAFDKRNPFKYANAIYKHQFVSISRDYYPVPSWQSSFRWTQVGKAIPSWILGNIKNSVNIKYHVEIPEQYFIDLYPLDNYGGNMDKCLAARKQAEEDIKKEIDECLAGEENASKIFYTKFAVDENNEPLPGWKINELKNDIKDAAWLNPYDTASAAICTAHNVDPELANLRSTKSLSSGSGSNIREKFNLHIQLKTVIARQTTLEPWELIKRVNNWPADIHLGYRDVFLETTDKSKTGTVVQNEDAPTTAG